MYINCHPVPENGNSSWSYSWSTVFVLDPAGSPSSTFLEPQVNDYVVVKLLAQRSVKHYIAVIMSKAEDEFVAKFMRKSLGNKFTFPATDDVANIDQDDIAEILSQPSVNNRQQYTFSLDISKYKNFG